MSIRKGRRQPPTANFLKSVGELTVTMATEYSLWFDDWWDYRNSTAGAKSKGVNWFGYFTPAQKHDPVCRALVDQGRRILDALRFSDRARRRKDSSIFEIAASSLRYLMHWMYINDVRSFSEMTPDQVGWFIEDVMKEQQDEFVRRLAQGDSDDPAEDARGVSATVLERYLTVIVDVYNLGPEFTELPELVMAAHPLRGISPYEVATEYGIVTSGWIPPVPDQVLHPLLEVAHRWVDTYSVDVLFAQDAYLTAFKNLGKTMPKNTPRSIQAALRAVKFDARGNLPTTWRPPLGRATARDGSAKRRGITIELRNLHYDLRNAATVVLQAETGIRVSEVAGITVDGRDENGWPSCLEVRHSSTGLYDLYVLKGRIFKGSPDPNGTEVEWILGAKPVGANSIPGPVKAILVLDALFKPWRERFGLNALIVSLGQGRGIPVETPENCEIRSTSIRDGQNDFLRDYVTVPVEFSKWRLTTHQFRKSFAQDVVRIDDTLIPAVRDHFKHMSDFVVESAYLGTDPRLLGLINDVATREAARLIVGTLFESQPLAGKMAELIKSRKKHFREVCSSARTNEGRINLLTIALDLDEIRFFSSEHADCFFRAHFALCHKDFLGEFDPNAKRPLGAYRTPKNCGDCPNGVKSRVHLPFWRERLRSYQEIEAANRGADEHRIVAWAVANVRQAERVIRQLEKAKS
ncbi:hypothetical protein [Agrobacterium rubi]|uniref:Tyr recombinase domain-containing protein n=1 Tax=Agrobacterium rubi TaxID=28099 RepID=A0AAE7URL8_9HYPH|nr:hypothetical protein [Agrobacterium rubi]NTE86109.1 hypothetical protein [Agrobacterium rubi]NTF02040.1 hypothetical protein [Agrobacterium rubi]NTF36284.1 hypothetical protein [Agrobacterium rubi]OCJ54555.1 hypothetical protein A6U92_21095 [Agrobacterium rubi]QTG01361.1 hypothetical protein G6M88_13615 [Agrobacterium rubi]